MKRYDSHKDDRSRKPTAALFVDGLSHRFPRHLDGLYQCYGEYCPANVGRKRPVSVFVGISNSSNNSENEGTNPEDKQQQQEPWHKRAMTAEAKFAFKTPTTWYILDHGDIPQPMSIMRHWKELVEHKSYKIFENPTP